MSPNTQTGAGPNNHTPKVSHSDLEDAAKDFLQVIAQSLSERIQQGVDSTVEETGIAVPEELREAYFLERLILEEFGASPQRRALTNLLVQVGIPQPEVPFGYLWPLIDQARASTTGGIEKVVQEFGRVVLDRVFEFRALDGLVAWAGSSVTLPLDNEVSIRPLSSAEIAQFSANALTRDVFSVPSKDWSVIDTRIHEALKTDDFPHPSNPGMRSLGTLRETALLVLTLSSDRSLRYVPLPVRVMNYGIQHPVMPGGYRERMVNGRGKPWQWSDEVCKRIKTLWPRARAIMGDDEHYLSLPARRLVDGGGRYRLDDAVLDYAIGLEALLTRNLRDELSYRLSLRGATVAAWAGLERKKAFEDLRFFYTTRSIVAHGERASLEDLTRAATVGEILLRTIWLWFFKQPSADHEQLTAAIDARILEGDIH